MKTFQTIIRNTRRYVAITATVGVFMAGTAAVNAQQYVAEAALEGYLEQIAEQGKPSSKETVSKSGKSDSKVESTDRKEQEQDDITYIDIGSGNKTII